MLCLLEWLCAADLEQVKLPSRCSCADEEVLGEQETLPLSLFPQREGAQADLAQHAPLAAGRQLDEGAWARSQKISSERKGDEETEHVDAEAKLTLPHEGLAGIQKDVAALHDHPLDGQVLPDVLRVAHLIVHHPATTTHRHFYNRHNRPLEM